MGYTVHGVDLEKFKKEVWSGCYAQPWKAYQQDYGCHLLGKYLYLWNDVQTKRAALLNANMASIAQQVQNVLQYEAMRNPFPQSGVLLYLPDTKRMLENIRKPLAKYRDALERLYRCCLKMDVDKNTGNKLGVLDYDRFYTWSQATFAELVSWERSSRSIGGSRALREDINCAAYAAGVTKQWDGTPMLTKEEYEVAQNTFPGQFDFGLQLQGVSNTKPFFSYNDVMEYHLNMGYWTLRKSGFDVKSHPITAANYGPGFAKENLQPGYHRVFLMVSLSQKAVPGDLKVDDFHWARLDEDGHWSDKLGWAAVIGERAGVNPTKMNSYLDGYHWSSGTFYKPLLQGENTIIPWGTGDTYDPKPYMPVAYYDICDKNRYSEKYKRLQNPQEASDSQRRKQRADALKRGTPEYQPSAEVNKMPRQERYQIFGTLGKQFLTYGQTTYGEHNRTTQKLQQQRNRARAVKPTQLRALVQDAEQREQSALQEASAEFLLSKNLMDQTPVPLASLGNPMGANPMGMNPMGQHF